MTVLWHIALCLEKSREKGRRNRSENYKIRFNRRNIRHPEAAQRWVLTEVEEAGEQQQQQVGGSGVHPE